MTTLNNVHRMLTHIERLKPDGTKSVTYGDTASCNGAFGPRTPINVGVIDAEVEAARCLRGVCRALGFPVPLRSVPPRTIAASLLRQRDIEDRIQLEPYVVDELAWLETALNLWHYELSGWVPEDAWLPMTVKRAAKFIGKTRGVEDADEVGEIVESIRHSDVATHKVGSAWYCNPVEVARVVEG